MLFFTRESFPTFRVDVDVLFGRELIGRGHEIDFVMQADAANVNADPITWRDRKVWLCGSGTGHGVFGRVGKQVRAFWHDVVCLLRLARGDTYDAIQVRNKFLIGALAAIVARRRGLRFFYWLSFPVPESQSLRASEGAARYPVVNRVRGVTFGWLLYRWILPRCDHAFVQSQRMKEDLGAMGVDTSKLTPVPMGVDLGDFPSESWTRAPDGSRNGTVLLGYLGTLNAQRKLDVLIEALSILCRAGVDAKLLFVGGSENAEDCEHLQRCAMVLGVSDRIEITGLLPRAQALERIQGVDIALSPFFPSPVLQSTSPTKLVEYLALGLPVVANTHPEQRVVLREARAGVCVPWGAAHFARGIRWLANKERAERHAIGLRGRLWVTEYREYSAIATAVERKYLEVLSFNDR